MMSYRNMTLIIIAIIINSFPNYIFITVFISTQLWTTPFDIAPKTFSQKIFHSLSHASDVHQFLGLLRQTNLLSGVFVCLSQLSSLHQMFLSMCLICNIFITILYLFLITQKQISTCDSFCFCDL